MMNRKTVFLYATSLCNHKCKHCYLPYHGSWDPIDLKNTVALLKRRYNVVINGAEPLLNINYLDAYECAGQTFIYSNGIILASSEGREMAHELLKHGIKQVRLSYHFFAVKELNAVPENIVEKAIDVLQECGADVELNVTIISSNYSLLDEMCDYCVNRGIRRIKFFVLYRAGAATELDEELFLTQEQKHFFYNEIQLLRTKYGIDILKIKIDGDFSGVSPKFKCLYAKDMFAITKDGKVYGCPFAVGNLNAIGYLNDEKEIIISNNEEYDSSVCHIHDVIRKTN